MSFLVGALVAPTVHVVSSCITRRRFDWKRIDFKRVYTGFVSFSTIFRSGLCVRNWCRGNTSRHVRLLFTSVLPFICTIRATYTVNIRRYENSRTCFFGAFGLLFLFLYARVPDKLLTLFWLSSGTVMIILIASVDSAKTFESMSKHNYCDWYNRTVLPDERGGGGFFFF